MDNQERESRARDTVGQSRGVDRRTWGRPTAEKTAQEITDELIISVLSNVPHVHTFDKLPHSVEGINAAMDLLQSPELRKSMSDPVDCYRFTT